MKYNKVKIALPLSLILIAFALGTFLYNKFPDVMTTHWGIGGEPNGYSSKPFAVFFMPVLSIFMLALFLFLPKTDPYKKNFIQFKDYFENFINLIIAFLFYVYVLSLAWNLGFRFNMIQLIAPAFAAIFYYAGILTEHAKRNWFVGIRTPWTLSNEEVWQKTHSIGGKLFKIIALLSLFGVIFPQIAIFLILIPVISVSIFVFVYSYIVSQQVGK